MKKYFLILTLVMAALLPLRSQEAAPAALPSASLDQRIAALEAYIGNGDPGASLTKDTNGALTVAAPATVGVAGPGHNAWMMTSTALVLFMTLPGLALFYGGLVRKKNILSVVAQCFGITGLVTILWVVCGYSFVFADGTDLISGVMGNLKFKMLEGVTSATNTNYAYWVSQNVFAMFQLMFAIITPALILGGHRRAHEVRRHPGVRGAVDAGGLFPAGPHGLGHQRRHERRLECRGEDPRD